MTRHQERLSTDDDNGPLVFLALIVGVPCFVGALTLIVGLVWVVLRVTEM